MHTQNVPEENLWYGEFKCGCEGRASRAEPAGPEDRNKHSQENTDIHHRGREP